MAYIVQTEVKGHPYYYLVRNERTTSGWKKHKLYLGKTVPDKTTIERLSKKLEDRKGSKKRRIFKPTFLSPEEKKRLVFGRHKSFEEEKDFVIQFSVHSNAIEGSPLADSHAKKIITGKKMPKDATLRSVYETVNTEEAYHFIKNYEGDVSRRFLVTLHSILMHRLMPDSGKFRTKNVKITGAGFHCPTAERLDHETERLLSFYRFLKRKYTPVETAALMHVKFIELHPFTDGNGRLGRLLMNFILMKNDLPPVIIRKEERKTYYRFLEAAITVKDYTPFVRFIYAKIQEKTV